MWRNAHPSTVEVGDGLVVEVVEVLAGGGSIVRIVQLPRVIVPRVLPKHPKEGVLSSLSSGRGLHRAILVGATAHAVLVPVQLLALHMQGDWHMIEHKLWGQMGV